MKRQMTLKERFMQKVDNDWHWIGAKNKDGYGQIKVDGVQMGAHVISYELFNGSVPEGMFILHSCDDPSCVNPEHLRLGTHLENMKDRMKSGHYKNMIGSNNMNAKMSDSQVLEIRNLYAEGNMSQSEIAKMFGIHQTQVSRYVRNETRRKETPS